jgi:hypothetical protein
MISRGFPVRRGADAGQIVAISHENDLVAIRLRNRIRPRKSGLAASVFKTDLIQDSLPGAARLIGRPTGILASLRNPSIRLLE